MALVLSFNSNPKDQAFVGADQCVRPYFTVCSR